MPFSQGFAFQQHTSVDTYKNADTKSLNDNDFLGFI